ncbi:MAG: hypothetical protein NTW86_17885 [Candidatus Sumerlaeota bacterium]|nr:hypothetical protein [Candidatus Sumerlaeota bacterium]
MAQGFQPSQCADLRDSPADASGKQYGHKGHENAPKTIPLLTTKEDLGEGMQ